MTAADIISAAELILINKCAAAADENGYVWKSSSYSDTEAVLGKERLWDAVCSDKKIIIDGAWFYSTDISYSYADGVKYKIITLKKNAVFSPDTISSEAFRSVMGCIRSVSTDISLSLDEIDHAVDDNDTVYIREHLDNIDRSFVLLYSQVLIPSELMLYCSDVRCTRTDIGKLISDTCTALCDASGKKMSFSMEGARDIYADIRPETFRVIISAFMAKAHRDGDVSYIRVSTEHSDGKVRIMLHAGGPHIKEKPVRLLDDSHYTGDSDNDILSALTDAFCTRFGGKYLHKKSGGTHLLGIILPESVSVYSISGSRIAALNQIAVSPDSRFSPEHALSSFKYKTYRYSEEV